MRLSGSGACRGSCCLIRCVRWCSTGKVGHVKQDPSGMAHYPGIHLISAAQLSNEVGPPQISVMCYFPMITTSASLISYSVFLIFQ